ncbi:hypothetical protein CALVIDRAFT_563080 [Calocera viscosa TUFC12733]|uniref:Uncharacterized protein n=1 Tax=Calocera viscosa (strain TUFC12733) TaxID=1330018 RepID=A0A167N2R1_CALVF|nr:hypothetical protein CALVIDRAFT_563080 [Calocera viscosa TUFC12733]
MPAWYMSLTFGIIYTLAKCNTLPTRVADALDDYVIRSCLRCIRSQPDEESAPPILEHYPSALSNKEIENGVSQAEKYAETDKTRKAVIAQASLEG